MNGYDKNACFRQMGLRWGRGWPSTTYDTRDALIVALSSMVGLLVEKACETGSPQRAMAQDVMDRAQELCGSPMPQARRDRDLAETLAKSVPA